MVPLDPIVRGSRGQRERVYRTSQVRPTNLLLPSGFKTQGVPSADPEHELDHVAEGPTALSAVRRIRAEQGTLKVAFPCTGEPAD